MGRRSKHKQQQSATVTTTNQRTAMSNSSNQLILNNKMVWQRVTVPGLIESYVTVPAVDAIPTFTWTGPKIPMALWRSILSYFKWSQDTHKCETQVRLFLNTATGTWRAWAFPQEKGGMTTKEIQGVQADEQRAALGPGLQEFGSVHHHCTAGAFQSGTDHGDESGRPGLHITVGHMESREHSLHSRVTFVHNGSKVMYSDPDLSQWFDAPDWFTRLDPNVIEMFGKDAKLTVVKRSLTTPSTDPFPEIWKTNLIERKWEPAGFNGTTVNGRSTISYGGLSGQAHWKPSEEDKAKFLIGCMEIADGFNISPEEFPIIFEAMAEIQQLIQRSPKVYNISDAQEIVNEAQINGDLDKLVERMEKERNELPGTGNGHPTKADVEEMKLYNDMYGEGAGAID